VYGELYLTFIFKNPSDLSKDKGES